MNLNQIHLFPVTCQCVMPPVCRIFKFLLASIHFTVTCLPACHPLLAPQNTQPHKQLQKNHITVLKHSLDQLLLCFYPATSYQKFTARHFPRQLSQSTIWGGGGHNGSNGCTFIPLSIAKLFSTVLPTSINLTQPLNQT